MHEEDKGDDDKKTTDIVIKLCFSIVNIDRPTDMFTFSTVTLLIEMFITERPRSIRYI